MKPTGRLKNLNANQLQQQKIQTSTKKMSYDMKPKQQNKITSETIALIPERCNTLEIPRNVRNKVRLLKKTLKTAILFKRMKHEHTKIGRKN